MITTLATLEQAQDELRDYEEANIPNIQRKLRAATASILAYIKAVDGQWMDSTGHYPQDSSGLFLTVPEEITDAVLLLLAIRYGENRDGAVAEPTQLGELPRSVTALVYRFRTPTLA